MKARQFRKLRKKIAKKGYYQKRYEALLKRIKRWEDFYKFECSDFFRGSDLADYNNDIYEANAPRLKQKADWYKQRLYLSKADLYKYASRV